MWAILRSPQVIKFCWNGWLQVQILADVNELWRPPIILGHKESQEHVAPFWPICYPNNDVASLYFFYISYYYYNFLYPNSQVKTISFLEQSLCCFLLLLFERGRFVRGQANENNWRSSTDLSGQYFLGIAILR